MVPTQANANRYQLYGLSANESLQNTYAGPNSIFTVQYNIFQKFIQLINKHWLDIEFFIKHYTIFYSFY